MNIFEAVILGVVEGLTEFLPISSTGHLILTAHLLDIPSSEFLKTFEIVIQLGAILAVIVLYWRRLLFDRYVMQRVALALVPALGVGLVFYSLIRKLLESELTVVMALFLGGIALIVFEKFHTEKSEHTLETMTYRQALTIGLFQALAVIPGVSRAGATILGGLLAGLTRKSVVEFSFLLGVPTMIAASTLDIVKNPSVLSSQERLPLVVGFVVSFLVAVMAIKYFLRFVETHSFIAFGVYRIAVSLLFFLFVL